MLKQDIIKARKELAAKEALERGYTFARTYKAIREALTSMVNGQPELFINSVSIKIPRYVERKLRGLGITVLQMPAYVKFRLTTLEKRGGKGVEDWEFEIY